MDKGVNPSSDEGNLLNEKDLPTASSRTSDSSSSQCRKHIEEIKSGACYISMDDASYVEIDYNEHLEYLKDGIPQHLAQKKLDLAPHSVSEHNAAVDEEGLGPSASVTRTNTEMTHHSSTQH